MASLRSRQSSERPNPRRDRAIEILLVAVIAVGFLGVSAVSGATPMATPTFVQGSARTVRGGTVNTLPFPQSTRPSDLIVVFAVWDNTAPMRLFDSAGNYFQVASPQTSWGPGWSAETLYAKNIKGGPDSVTAMYTNAITSFGQIYIHEYTGVATSLIFDVSKSATGTGSAMSSGAATTRHSNDLIFAGGASKDTVTSWGNGFHARSTAFANLTEDRSVTSRGSYEATGTQNSDAWVMQMTAFKAATLNTSTSSTATTATTAATVKAPGVTGTSMPSTTDTTMGMPSTTGTTVPMSSTTATTMATMLTGGADKSGGGMGGGGMSGTPDQCELAQLAFCDTFQTINSGGRAGDLDESKWSFSRVTQQNNPAAGQVNNYAPVQAQFCMDQKVVLVPNDSFICGQQYGESNHWMEAMNDQNEYASQGARILQPFDFANRTGSIVFDVDAKTEGTHSSWPEVWLTADPDQQPHDDFPGTHMFPKEGVMLNFGADWCGNSGNGGDESSSPHNPVAGNVRVINEYHNYTETSHDVRFQGPCYTTASDHANHFKITVSQTLIQVWASDDNGSNFVLHASQPVNLPFTRGYLTFEHAEYFANKFDNMNPTTYHWHAIGFDGPVLPVDRDYQVPDAMQPAANGTVNLGYQTPTATFSLPSVDPAGTTKAHVTFDVWWFASPQTLNVTLNGHTYAAHEQMPDAPGHAYQWQYLDVPVNLADVHTGTNTLQIANTGCSDQCPTIANIDLELTP